MTRHTHDSPHDHDTPLAPWMLDLVHEVTAEADAKVEVPREMMWARIQRARHARPAAARRPWYASRQVVAAAAVLVCGVAIGRYVVPSSGDSRGVPAPTAGGVPPLPTANADPSHVAMQEHLVRTVALLTSVRDEASPRNADADFAPLAKELLATTRLLLDQPQLRDERTRRLLQDLELVLMQVIQARSTAPETERAPRETLRETNLLTRMNALVTASSRTDAAIYGGDD